MIGRVGDAETTQVADILPERQSSIHPQAGQSLERVVLEGQSVDQLLECNLIPGLPPGAQHSPRIGLRPLIVKTMPHLVSDHAAYAAVVDRRIGSRIKKWRLQNGRWED